MLCFKWNFILLMVIIVPFYHVHGPNGLAVVVKKKTSTRLKCDPQIAVGRDRLGFFLHASAVHNDLKCKELFIQGHEGEVCVCWGEGGGGGEG